MWEDPIVNGIRTIRKELEAKFDFDSKSIFNDIRQRQVSLGSRLVNRRKIIAEQLVAPDRNSAALHPGR